MMVSAKQKHLRIFEISGDDKEELLAYLEKNAPLFRNFLLYFTSTIDENIEAFLKQSGFCYITPETCQSQSFSIKEHKKEKEEEPKESTTSHTQTQPVTPLQETKIIQKTVRSGEEICYDGDLIVCDRVNSGARIECQGTLHLYGKVDGIAECHGPALVIRHKGSGHILFHGEIIDQERLQDGAQTLLTLHEGQVQYKEIG